MLTKFMLILSVKVYICFWFIPIHNFEKVLYKWMNLKIIICIIPKMLQINNFLLEKLKFKCVFN